MYFTWIVVLILLLFSEVFAQLSNAPYDDLVDFWGSSPCIDMQMCSGPPYHPTCGAPLPICSIPSAPVLEVSPPESTPSPVAVVPTKGPPLEVTGAGQTGTNTGTNTSPNTNTPAPNSDTAGTSTQPSTKPPTNTNNIGNTATGNAPSANTNTPSPNTDQPPGTNTLPSPNIPTTNAQPSTKPPTNTNSNVSPGSTLAPNANQQPSNTNTPTNTNSNVSPGSTPAPNANQQPPNTNTPTNTNSNTSPTNTNQQLPDTNQQPPNTNKPTNTNSNTSPTNQPSPNTNQQPPNTNTPSNTNSNTSPTNANQPSPNTNQQPSNTNTPTNTNSNTSPTNANQPSPNTNPPSDNTKSPSDNTNPPTNTNSNTSPTDNTATSTNPTQSAKTGSPAGGNVPPGKPGVSVNCGEMVKSCNDGNHVTVTVSVPINGGNKPPKGSGLSELQRDANTTFDFCPVTFKRKGCYKDKHDGIHPLPELLFTDRDSSSKVFSGTIISSKDWGNYILKLICRCAEQANQKRFTFFGIQRYGDCWSGMQSSVNSYETQGTSKSCIARDQSPCEEDSEACVGENGANFVYELTGGPGPEKKNKISHKKTRIKLTKGKRARNHHVLKKHLQNFQPKSFHGLRRLKRPR